MSKEGLLFKGTKVVILGPLQQAVIEAFSSFWEALGQENHGGP